MNIVLTDKQIKELQDNLSYEEKLKLVFSLIPWNDFHNYRYREEVARQALGIPPRTNRKTTGEDLPNLSLKSIKSKNRAKKSNKFTITTKQVLGKWGRIDLDTTFDKKDTVCDIWGDDSVILRIRILYDENFEKLYENEKNKKLKYKTDKKNIVDMGSFTIQDLLDFNVKYETLYVDNDNVIVKFPLSNNGE
jgi:hypothetical protein